MSIDKEISRIKEYAKNNNGPIMTDDGIEFLMKYIKSVLQQDDNEEKNTKKHNS